MAEFKNVEVTDTFDQWRIKTNNLNLDLSSLLDTKISYTDLSNSFFRVSNDNVVSLAPNAINDSMIAPNANINGSKILNNTIVDAKIASNANINGSKIKDSSISYTKLSAGAPQWSTNGYLTISGTDFNIYNASRATVNGDQKVHNGRALVHGSGDELVINYNSDYTGGTRISSFLNVEPRGGSDKDISAKFRGTIQVNQSAEVSRAYAFLSTSPSSAMIGGNLRLTNGVTSTGVFEDVSYEKGTNQRGAAAIEFVEGSSTTGEIVFLRANDTNGSNYTVTESARINGSGNLILKGNLELTKNGATITSGGGQISTRGGDLYLNYGAIITNSGNGDNPRLSTSTNVDHIWHDDDNIATGNSWHFCSDTTYKATGNSALRAREFVGSSDYRLKKDIVELDNSTALIKRLKPCSFTWKSNGKQSDGFIAHELQQVLPQAVYGNKDEVDANSNPVYQGIAESKLIPLLTKVLQETIAKVESLEARLKKLEK